MLLCLTGEKIEWEKEGGGKDEEWGREKDGGGGWILGVLVCVLVV